MTPRERVFAALRGEMADRVPLTAYGGLLPRGETERKLRNEGLTILDRIPVFATETPNVMFERSDFMRDGRRWVRHTYRTPVGEVTEALMTGGGYGTSLRHEFLIKRPEDYEILLFMVRDEVYTPTYDGFLAHLDTVGEDMAVLGNLGYSPLQHMLITLMGPERFAVDMVERPREFFELYEALAERRREQYEIAANSPAEVFTYGDNVTCEMVGEERFRKYIAPCYDEFAELLHAKGKLLGSHLDGMMVGLKEAVAETKLDFIEAFAAFPDGDLPLADARKAWPDKVISTNFPSPIHLESAERIEDYARQMLADVAPGDRFIVGVTENIPGDVWQVSLTTVSRVLREEGALPLGS